MKNFTFSIAILIAGLFLGGTAFADVKIKSKQTMRGQSYESTTYIKGKRQRSEMMNGMSVSLTQCDLRRSVTLNPNSKTYMVSAFPETTQTVTKPASTTVDKDGVVHSGGTVTTTVTIKDTGERKQMFGFTARHLIITMETASSPDACNKTNSKIQTDGWYIDAEFVLDCDYGMAAYTQNSSKSDRGCRDKYQMKTVGTAKRGYPVLETMTMFDASGKETYSMTNEVVELSRATLEASLFDVPADYREAKDAMEMYASGMGQDRSSSSMKLPNSGTNPSTAAGQNGNTPAATDAKKPGVLRIGVVGVKTTAVGDGINAEDLSAAVRNTLAQRLNSPNIEVVVIQAESLGGIDTEARQKECDYLIRSTVSHKKGGGGFGGFGSVLGSAIANTVGHSGNTAANIAGQVAAEAVITAASVSAGVKAKDEVSLDLKLNTIDGSPVLAKAYKAKAKSNGEDIISQVVEQAAQAVMSAVTK